MFFSLPKKGKTSTEVLDPDYFGTQMKERIFFKITLTKDMLWFILQ